MPTIISPEATSSQRYLLWGSAGHAKVLASAISLRGGEVIALFDNEDVPSALTDVPLFIGESAFSAWLKTVGSIHQIRALVAIGGARGRDRLRIHAMFLAYGLQVTALIHPDASVCTTSHIGDGSQILAKAVVAAEAKLGDACIINHAASVDHECILGDGVHIAPGATICGCVQLGDNVMVGAGAIILPRIKVGFDAIIGAGAIVTKDVPSSCIVMGNPSRVVRKIN